MPVQPEDAAEQFLPEAAHHAQHHDQRGDAERDADQRESGDDGDEALPLPRPEVAAGDRAFEGAEHANPIHGLQPCRSAWAGSIRAARQLG